MRKYTECYNLTHVPSSGSAQMQGKDDALSVFKGPKCPQNAISGRSYSHTFSEDIDFRSLEYYPAIKWMGWEVALEKGLRGIQL